MSLDKNILLLSATVLLASGLMSLADNPSNPSGEAVLQETNTSVSNQPPKVEAFTVIGTGSYSGGAMAVFDGNNPTFKTSAHPGGKVGAFTLVAVDYDSVRLRADGREIDLSMDMQLRRENEGNWQLVELTERFTPVTLPPAYSAPLPTVPSQSRVPVVPDPGMAEKQLLKLEKYLAELERKGKEFKHNPSDKGNKLAKHNAQVQDVMKKIDKFKRQGK
jgi:hypothetical protein